MSQRIIIGDAAELNKAAIKDYKDWNKLVEFWKTIPHTHTHTS